VEVDLWCVEGQLYLGHDYAKYHYLSGGVVLVDLTKAH